MGKLCRAAGAQTGETPHFLFELPPYQAAIRVMDDNLAVMHLLERQEQLETLNRCFQQARAGSGKLVLIAGEPGLAEVFRNANANQLAESSGTLAAKRATWAPVVGKVVGLLGGSRAVVNRDRRPIWVDVGCGDGALVMSMPDLMSSSWKVMDAENANPYWMELEHYHNFSLERIVALLRDSDFEIVDFAIPNRYKAQMEIYAVRK